MIYLKAHKINGFVLINSKEQDIKPSRPHIPWLHRTAQMEASLT